MAAHVKAFSVIKGLLTKINLLVLHFQLWITMAEGGQQSRDIAHAETVDVCLDQTKEDDFIGIQTYTRHTYGPEGIMKLTSMMKICLLWSRNIILSH